MSRKIGTTSARIRSCLIAAGWSAQRGSSNDISGSKIFSHPVSPWLDRGFNNGSAAVQGTALFLVEGRIAVGAWTIPNGEVGGPSIVFDNFDYWNVLVIGKGRTRQLVDRRLAG